ncbi:MAG: hypothetical protein KA303_02520 [Paludibacter sp.]|nr:hypothetical protein [Paludibacter sp.]
MKVLKIILLTVVVFLLNIHVYSQENNTVQERTPEQEAIKQTEKLQNELQLTPEQVQRVNEINLKYARERQASNNRRDAIKRIKDKDNDLQKVLNQEQYQQLQNKRYERSSFQSPATGSSFRSTQTPRPDSRTQSTRTTQAEGNERRGSSINNSSSESRQRNPSTRPQTIERQGQAAPSTYRSNPTVNPGNSSRERQGSAVRNEPPRTSRSVDNSGSRNTSTPTRSTESSSRSESSRSSGSSSGNRR